VECSAARNKTKAARRSQARWVKRNPNALSKWRAKNHERTMIMKARARAKLQGVPCDITHEDIKIPTHCRVLGIKLKWDSKHDYKPSIDRIIPKLGYVKNNINVISLRANRFKSNMIKSDIMRLLSYLEECNV
jgi:hypothetical protein